MIIRLYTLLIFITITFYACEYPFPKSEKLNVPNDHKKLEGGFAHMENPENASTCSESNCHKSDLKGGYVLHDGVKKVTPSCYQCHEKNWK